MIDLPAPDATRRVVRPLLNSRIRPSVRDQRQGSPRHEGDFSALPRAEWHTISRIGQDDLIRAWRTGRAARG